MLAISAWHLCYLDMDQALCVFLHVCPGGNWGKPVPSLKSAQRLPQLIKAPSPRQDGGDKGGLVFCSCPALLLWRHELFREVEIIVMNFILGSW